MLWCHGAYNRGSGGSRRGHWATSDNPALAPRPGSRASRPRIAQWPSRAGRRRGLQHRRLWRKIRVAALAPGLASREVNPRQTYRTSTSPSASASRGPVQRANSCGGSAALQGHDRHSGAAKDLQLTSAAGLRLLSSGCYARPPPTELSAPASNRAATSPASDNTPQAPCDLPRKVDFSCFGDHPCLE
ncbi:hypothetical protein ACVWZL_009046 [Bradyrhizobium sp. GM2.4]